MSRMVLINGAAPSTPASGKTAIYCGTDKVAKQIDDAGVIRALGGYSARLSAPVATSGASECLIMNSAIPANSVAVGDMFWISCQGISSSTGTLIFRLRVGINGTTADTQCWISITSAAQVANQRAGFDGLFVVRSIGSGGTIQCECIGYAQAALLPTLVAGVATPTMNTTVGNYIDICCTCSSGTWTCQEAIVMKV